MKKKSQPISFMIVIILFCLFASNTAFAGEFQGPGATSGTCGKALTWALSSSGDLTISGTGEMDNYSSGLTPPWEALGSSVLKIVVESGVTTIGNGAFSCCSNLQILELSEGLLSIGDDVFWGCSKLTPFVFPTSLESIGNHAFDCCSSLTSLTLPDNITSVGSYAFRYCHNLRNITLSSGLKTIPYSMFWDCPLQEVVIPEGVICIKEYAFLGNPLSKVYLPSTIKSIERNAFSSCSRITDVYYSGTRAEGEAIQIESGNSYLTSAVWYCSDGEYQGIGTTSGTCGKALTWALSSSGELTISGTGEMDNYSSGSTPPWEALGSSVLKIVVESGVTTIGNGAFSCCSNLQILELSEGLLSIGDDVFWGCSKLTPFVFPTSLESIGNHAFDCCSSLTSLTLPDNITSVGSYAFRYCHNLRNITLSSGLKTIPYSMFWDCPLQEVYIPEGIVSIGEDAFYSCDPIARVHLPSTIESIGKSAFGYCSRITDVYYSGTRTEGESIQIESGNSYLTSAVWHYIYKPTETLTTIQLPSSLLIVDKGSFFGTSTQKVIIPPSVKVIDSSAFVQMPNLQVLFFEGSPESISSDILDDCQLVYIDCVQGSTAETWARDHNYPIAYH